MRLYQESFILNLGNWHFLSLYKHPLTQPLPLKVNEALTWLRDNNFLNEDLEMTPIAMACRDTSLIPQHYIFLQACGLFGLLEPAASFLTLCTHKDSSRVYNRVGGDLPGRTDNISINTKMEFDWASLVMKMITFRGISQPQRRKQFCQEHDISFDVMSKLISCATNDFEKPFKLSRQMLYNQEISGPFSLPGNFECCNITSENMYIMKTMVSLLGRVYGCEPFVLSGLGKCPMYHPNTKDRRANFLVCAGYSYLKHSTAPTVGALTAVANVVFAKRQSWGGLFPCTASNAFAYL